MTIRMTKKREKALHTALSLDDLLYEKFRRLNEQLQRDVRRFLKDPARVMRVIQKDKDGNYLMLQILETHVTDQGTEITVGGFSDGKK
jgi:hypothetical protein